VSAALRLASFTLWLLLLAGASGAHPLAPSLLDLRVAPDGTTQVRFKRPALQPRGAPVEPTLPSHCVQRGEVETVREGTGVVSTWQVDCGDQGLVGYPVGFRGFAESGTNGLVKIELPGGSQQQAVLHSGQPSIVVAEESTVWDAARDYALLGFQHILGGLDHLLFVAGLLLLVPGMRQLVATVTAFTIGHSITLSMAALGFVSAPSGPIEFAIAASIVYLATEIANPRDGEPLSLWRRPYVLAGSFGLLHGFGFAGALAEVGLPSRDIPVALASFNLGIEIGQLAFVGVLVGVFVSLQRLAVRPPRWGRSAAAYGIGSLAAMWMFERLANLL
jgi:hydrogenase/urease accessory protein HupE